MRENAALREERAAAATTIAMKSKHPNRSSGRPFANDSETVGDRVRYSGFEA
jgi:hypothetical protein